ncbi:F-box/kelch-repeat protein At3g06240-like [Primulina tabacum]|uniref:F-box/kelch-repeat protein At3g06240-like n=1 Tax=Primulina tabacum TaxID=48773 RepID=UPI003F59B7EA
MSKLPSILMDLPSEIIVNILSRLPSRTIVSCKCVCKQWHKLLSSPEFVKFHVSVSTPEVLVLQIDPKGECLCKFVEHEDQFQHQLQGFRWNQAIKFDPKTFISSPEDYRLEMKGSVDGFLCLQYSSKIDDVICVCNPITREYISLPRLTRVVEYANFTHYGFGVSSITGQYKVIYMFQKSVRKVWQCVRSENYECEFYDYMVYTLGAGSWRSTARNSPFDQAHLFFGVFLNGNLHGLVQNSSRSAISISCFDLEAESFEPFSPPPYPLKLVWFGGCDILGVLDDCLCICDSSSLRDEGGIVFWTMKEYGVTESWTRLFVFVGTQICSSFPFEVVHPIGGYKNGDILFSWKDQMVFYYSSKTETSHKVDIHAQDLDTGGWIKTTLHNSSFLSPESFDEEKVISFADLSGC